MQASIQQQPVAPKPHAYAQAKVNKQVVYAEVHNEDINEDNYQCHTSKTTARYPGDRGSDYTTTN